VKKKGVRTAGRILSFGSRPKSSRSKRRHRNRNNVLNPRRAYDRKIFRLGQRAGFVRTYAPVVQYTYLNGNVSSGPNVQAALNQRQFWTKSGLVTGNFKDPNPYGYSYNVITLPYGKFLYRITYTSYNVSETRTGPLENVPELVTPELEPWSEVRNKCIERLYEKLRGRLDLSIDVGESHKTARSVRALTQYLLKGIASVKSGLKGPLVSRLDRVGNRGRSSSTRRLLNTDIAPGSIFQPSLYGNQWLQWQYGLRPLVNDVYDAYKELHDALPVREYVTASYTSKVGHTTNDVFLFGLGLREIPVMGMSKRGVKMKIFYRNLGYSADRFTSLNPINIGYELLSYSFVLDWFYNLGGYLRSLETAMLYQNQFQSGFESHLEIHDRSIDVNQSGYLGNQYFEYYYKAHVISKEFARIVVTESPVPEIPSFNVKLGWERLLSAGALLAQHLPRK